MKVFKKWLEEAPIFKKLEFDKNIHEAFSFSATLKTDFCNTVVLQIFSLVESCCIEIRVLLPATFLKVSFLGISRTNTLQRCIQT